MGDPSLGKTVVVTAHNDPVQQVSAPPIEG